MVLDSVSTPTKCRAIALHLRELDRHSNGRSGPGTPTIRSGLAPRLEVRHGPCLLVHQDDVSPGWGRVNEEILA